MNSYERMCAALTHQVPDTVPVAPFLGVHTAIMAGIPVGKYLTDENAMFEAQSIALEDYDQDAVLVNGDNYYIAEGFGVQTTHYENATPTFLKPAVDDVFHAECLQVPDPYRDGRMPVYLGALKQLAEKYKYKKFIRGCGTGPFSLASHLVGTEKFLNDVIDAVYLEDTDKFRCIRQLMEKSCEALLAFTIAELSCGADMVQCGDSLASLSVISPPIYEQIVLPYEKRFVQELQPYLKKYHAFTILHICGNTELLWPHYIEAGFDCTEIDYKCDIGKAKAALENQVAIQGNIDPSSVLLLGTPEKVRQTVETCIENAASHCGFILGSGCDIAPFTPKENMRMMVKTAREYGFDSSGMVQKCVG